MCQGMMPILGRRQRDHAGGQFGHDEARLGPFERALDAHPCPEPGCLRLMQDDSVPISGVDRLEDRIRCKGGRAP